MKHEIFVFGSNELGVHGAGAALYAKDKYGAAWGMGFGPSGRSFAIPTKDWDIERLPLSAIEAYVNRFIAYANHQHTLSFKITQIDCGLAGFTKEEIAPLFKNSPDNCYFDEAWKPILGDKKKYWGTV